MAKRRAKFYKWPDWVPETRWIFVRWMSMFFRDVSRAREELLQWVQFFSSNELMLHTWLSSIIVSCFAIVSSTSTTSQPVSFLLFPSFNSCMQFIPPWLSSFSSSLLLPPRFPLFRFLLSQMVRFRAASYSSNRLDTIKIKLKAEVFYCRTLFLSTATPVYLDLRPASYATWLWCPVT